MKSVCIFAGSSPSALARYRKCVEDLVEELARREATVVFGGVDIGMMGHVSRCAVSKGLRVIGIAPRLFLDKGLTLVPGVESLIVDTMSERIQQMFRLSDCFVSLPGGYGTFEEIFQVLSMLQLGESTKPCGIVNIDGFFDPMLDQILRARDAGFIRYEHSQMLVSETCPIRLLERIEAFQVPSIMKWSERET